MRDYGLHYRKKRAAGRASARRIVNRAAHATFRADCERKITKDDSGRVRVRACPSRKIIILKALPDNPELPDRLVSAKMAVRSARVSVSDIVAHRVRSLDSRHYLNSISAIERLLIDPASRSRC
jgi:anti-sigma factor RsiW